MNQDDLFDTGNSWDIDDLLKDLQNSGQEDSADLQLDDILKEFGLDPASAKDLSGPELLPQADNAAPGTYRSVDGSREFGSFDGSIPEVSPDEWYQYTPSEEDLDGEYENTRSDYYDLEDDEEYEDDGPRHPILRGIGTFLLVICTVAAAFYLAVIYSGIPLLTHLRTMYIETAMSTINHKWLATAIVPSEQIDEVLRLQYELDDEMVGKTTDWSTVQVEELPTFEDYPVPSAQHQIQQPQTSNAQATPEPTGIPEDVEVVHPTDPAEDAFFEIFWELDRDSVEKYMEDHPEALANGWAGIDINESSLNSNGTAMETIYGDQVLAVNAVDGITLIRIYLSANKSRGVLAICKDTSRLSLCAASTLGTTGQTAGKICKDNGGILAMTGSAFMDDGNSNGGQISGLAICSGKSYGSPLGAAGDKRLELRNDDKMYIVDSSSPVGSGTRDACEFHPGLIIDGTIYYNDYWSSPNPRAVLGQSSRLETMMVVLEGRLTSSLGCGVDYVSEKLKEYGCVQALNLDGGTSSMMYYKGEYINLCSNPAIQSQGGRTLPTAWVYKPAS